MNELNFKLIELASKYDTNFNKVAAIEIASAQKNESDFSDEIASSIISGRKTESEKTKAALEIASVIIEKVTDEWDGIDLSKVFEIRNLKAGDTKRISFDHNFRATYLNKGANSIENTLDVTDLEVPTSVIDVMVDVSIFKFISGRVKASEIEKKMLKALNQKITTMALEVMIASTDTTVTDLYTSLSGSGDVSGDFQVALAKCFKNVKNAAGVVGTKGNVFYTYDFTNYSNSTLEKIDGGKLQMFRGLPLITVDEEDDKNGLSLLTDKATNNISDTVIVPAKGKNFIVYEGTVVRPDPVYDPKNKKFTYNIIALVGAASISDKNGRILMTI